MTLTTSYELRFIRLRVQVRKWPKYNELNDVNVTTRSQAVARIADRTAKNCSNHMTYATPTFRDNYLWAR